MILEIGIGIGAVLLLVVICAFSWYEIVDPSEAHLVVTPNRKFVVSSDDKVATDKIKTYFAIPKWLPFFGRSVRIMDVTIKEIRDKQETIEKGQARFSVNSSTKYKINDVKTAAETFISSEELDKQLIEVIRASVRATTVKYDIENVRSKKKDVEDAVRKEMEDDLAKWGLELVNFQLVNIEDTEDSEIVSNISKRREKEIESQTRQQNAEKDKAARIKEAESVEKAREREIEKDQKIAEKEQLKAQKISEQEKTAKEKAFEVIKVETIKQAEIDKEKAEILAEQEKEVAIIKADQEKQSEKIMKDKKELEGQGDRLRSEEKAKGDAATVKEQGLAEAEATKATGLAEAEIIKAKGLAEAEAIDKKQEALNKFTEISITALTAEKVVEKDQAIGVATAKALETADLKVFSGGESDREGFNLGKLIESTSIASESTAKAVKNKMARPNDLGMTALALEKIKEDNNKKSSSE